MIADEFRCVAASCLHEDKARVLRSVDIGQSRPSLLGLSHQEQPDFLPGFRAPFDRGQG